MSQNISDLNSHLFAQLDRLSDENLNGEKLEQEITRSKAMNDVATKIIAGGELVLRAHKMVDDRMNADLTLPKLLE